MISIIIPTYNRWATLERAIRSVQAQDFQDWELILVDDGSTDETAAGLRHMQDQWQRPQALRVFVQTNLGVSAARNRGAKEARGKWLAFLDSDDEWFPSKLTLQLQLAKSSGLPLIHGEEIWMRNGVRVNPKLKYKKSGGQIFERCVDHCCISVTTALIDRDFFNDLNGFRDDFKVCEDYELWLRVCAKTAVGFVEAPVAIKYGGHIDQLSTQFHSMDYFRVKALVPFFKISKYAAQVAATKCEILLKGYEKHREPKNANAEVEVRHWHQLAIQAENDAKTKL